MARSDYVYVVTKEKDVLAAFTVRHELASWMYRRCDQDVTVSRVSDGLTGGDSSRIAYVDPAELRHAGYLKALRNWERSLPEHRGPKPEPR